MEKFSRRDAIRRMSEMHHEGFIVPTDFERISRLVFRDLETQEALNC